MYRATGSVVYLVIIWLNVTAACEPVSSKSQDIECRKTVSCDSPMDVGTVVDFKCKTSYQQITEYNFKTIRCLPTGKWNKPLPDCNPVCGKRIPKGTPQISHGQKTEVGEFPWHVAIYELINSSQQQICGGSLISTRFVISAAHCFWDKSESRLKDKKRYTIAMGKYFRSYDVKDEGTELRNVADILIPDRYHDRLGNFASDIALVALDVEVVLTWMVQPVCIDWGSDKEREQLSSNQFGSVEGWGFTESNLPSEELQTAKLSFVEYNTCLAKLPPSFTPLVTNDKFCAGYENGTSVCRGGSGGGLVFEDPTSHQSYLRGILSVGVTAPEGQVCSFFKYTVFTKVSSHLEWIDTSMKKYLPARR